MRKFYKVYISVKLNTSDNILYSNSVLVIAEDEYEAQHEAMVIVWNSEKLDKSQRAASQPCIIKRLDREHIDILPGINFADEIPVVNSVYCFTFKVKEVRYE